MKTTSETVNTNLSENKIFENIKNKRNKKNCICGVSTLKQRKQDFTREIRVFLCVRLCKTNSKYQTTATKQ